MKYKIIVDSCGELTPEMKQDERFASAALTLEVGADTIVDDDSFDQADFLRKVAAYPECPKSACPSPEVYQRGFEADAEHLYAVTLSAELSGSYNSAELGKSLTLEEHPDKKIHVFNSKSASIGETLIALKIQEWIPSLPPFGMSPPRTEARPRKELSPAVLHPSHPPVPQPVRSPFLLFFLLLSSIFSFPCTRSVSDSFLPLCTGHIAAIIISTLTGAFNCKKAIDITFCLLYDNHDK